MKIFSHFAFKAIDSDALELMLRAPYIGYGLKWMRGFRVQQVMGNESAFNAGILVWTRQKPEQAYAARGQRGSMVWRHGSGVGCFLTVLKLSNVKVGSGTALGSLELQEQSVAEAGRASYPRQELHTACHESR